MQENIIHQLRHTARKLIRELGMLQLNTAQSNRRPQHWHTLIEIANHPNITMAKLGHLFLLSISSMSRIVAQLVKEGLVNIKTGIDNREKYLRITDKGLNEIKIIDDYSNLKIRGALEYLNLEDQKQIITSMKKYADALEKSRTVREQVKIHTLSTSRAIRRQIMSMITNIQINELGLTISQDLNSCILKAEDEFYFNQSYNFWYAINNSGKVIGSIGLKKIDSRQAELKKFFVDAHYRGKNVGRKLLASLLKSALKHQFKFLYLGAVSSSHVAQHFYEKYSFSRINKKELPKGFISCELDTFFYKANIKDLQNTLKQMDANQ